MPNPGQQAGGYPGQQAGSYPGQQAGSYPGQQAGSYPRVEPPVVPYQPQPGYWPEQPPNAGQPPA